MNDFAQSVWSYTPLEPSFEKEAELLIQTNFSNLVGQVRSLQPYKFVFNDVEITTFKVHLTLFDQKCINAIPRNRSTVKCPIYNMSSCNFHEEQPPQIIMFAVSLGLGPLHCSIRTIKHFSHIAYKLLSRK